MHEYEACPLHTNDISPNDINPNDISPKVENRISNGFPSQDNSASTFEGSTTSEVSSLHSSLDPPIANPSSASPSKFHVDPLGSTGSDAGNHHSLPSTRGISKWQTAWRLQTFVLGLYVLSLLLAVAHCLFFQYLDGRILSPGIGLPTTKTTTIPQGYVTALSFLLITAFRAALVASVGICYTQYLWATLRTKVLKVSLVEDLFQIQTNAFHLTSTQIYFKTPILATVAIFCWLIPVATVYPPGTLVVEVLHGPVEMPLNVSVLHSKDYMYKTNPSALSEIWCSVPGSSGIGPLKEEYMQQNASILKTCKSRWGHSQDLKYITRLSLMSRELATLALSTGENASYTTQFWGVALECHVSNRTLELTVNPADIYVPDSRSLPDRGWWVRNFISPCQLWFDTSYSVFGEPETRKLRYQVSHYERTYQYFPCVDTANGALVSDQSHGHVNFPQTGVRILINITETVCRPRLTRYTLSVSSTGGIQHISYVLDNEEPEPAYSKDFGNFSGSYEQWVQFSDAMSVYYEFAANFNRTPSVNELMTFNHTERPTIPTFYTTSNGTRVETCLINRAPRIIGADFHGYLNRYSGQYQTEQTDEEIWPLSVFERRYDGEREWDGAIEPTCPHFDVDLAKQLLINTTISALSLNKNIDTVLGTVTRAFNVYRFRNRLSFFLPYSLCVGLAVPIILLGLVAFYTKNEKTSAITGGFLQLLMTTTGRTQLEKLVMGSASMGGYENVTDELKAAEITFGELIDVGNDVSDKEVLHNSCSNASTEEESTSETMLLGSAQQVQRPDARLEIDVSGTTEGLELNAGFGLAREVKQLRRRNVK